MRRHLLSATSLATTLLFLVPGLALAQGAPKDWTGPYVGFGIGGVSASDTIDFAFSTPTNNQGPSNISVPVLGPAGTITAGYDKQVGNFVYGIEADGTLVLGSGSATATKTSVQENLDALLALRGRFGIASGNLLAFATAGISGGYENFYAKLTSTGFGTVTGARGAGIVVGPTVGLGVEYGLTDKISLTAEGSVAELGSLTATGDNGKGPYTATNHTTVVGVKSGLNFHF